MEVSGKELTPGEIAERLPEVPQATLYRHINQLREGGILEIASARPVNGATERVYRVALSQGRLTPDELQGLSAEDHLRYFTVFAASLIDAFGVYLDRADLAQIGDDGMAYNQAVIYLNDAERQQFQDAVVNLITDVLSHQPSPDRKRYTLASIVIPDQRTSS